jgi:hypothetical protein
VVP